MQFDMEKFDVKKYWKDRFDPEFKLARNLEKEKGFDAAKPHYTKLYKGGNLLAGVRLGACYSAGHGYRVDYPKAIRIFEDCMENGNPLAAAMLARLYCYGIGVEADEETARELYSSCEKGLQAMCEEGYDEARYIWGLVFWFGMYGKEDMDRGFDLIRKAADTGCLEACVEIAWIGYRTGKLTPDECYEYCNKAKYDPEAIVLQYHIDRDRGVSLERYVRKIESLETRIDKDEKAGKTGYLTPYLHRLVGDLWKPCFEWNDAFAERALDHYCKALAGGQDCLYDAAVLSFDHGSESRYLSREELLEQLKKAAREEEDTKFAMLLGRIYNEGIGMPGCPEEAAEWYQTAFGKTGDRYAGFYLVKHYRGEGQPERAFGLLRDMADKGCQEAAYFLALAFRDGDGTEPDKGKARKYLKQAAQNGCKKAQRIRNRWKNWMVPKTRSSGESVFPGDVNAEADQGQDPLEAIRRQEELAAALQERYEDTGAETDGYALFDAQRALGDAWLKLRRLMEARSAFKSLLELGVELEMCFQTTQARRCLATGYEKIGVTDSSRVGDALFGARNYYIKARELRKRLYAETGTAQDGRALAACYGLFGTDDSAFGEWAFAETHYEKARAICERIYKESEDAEDCRDLAKYYRLLGTTNERISQQYPEKRSEYDARIRSCYKKSLELSEKAYAEAQSHGSRRTLAYSYMAMGDEAKRDGILSVTGRDYYEKSRALFEELYEEGRTPEAGRDLFLIYMQMGRLLDKLPEYYAYFVKALRIAEQLYQETRTLQAKLDLKKIYLIMSGLSKAMGNEDKKAYYAEQAGKLTIGFLEDSEWYENQAFARKFFLEEDPVIPFSGLTGLYDSIETSVSAEIYGLAQTPASAQEPARQRPQASKGKADYVDFNAARKTVICFGSFLIAVRNDGMVYCAAKNGDYTGGPASGRGHITARARRSGLRRRWGGPAAGWDDITAVDVIGCELLVGLRTDGRVVVAKDGSYDADFFGHSRDWRDIVAIATAPDCLVGLKSDGTVAALGYDRYYQCEVEDFRDIVQIGCGKRHTVGLKSDGTVMAAGRDDRLGEESPGGFIWYEQDDPRRRGELLPQCRVGDWRDVKEIRVAEYATFGRRSDGTWLCAAQSEDLLKQEDEDALKNGVYSIEFDGDIIRLRTDGTFEVEGDNHPEIREWTNIKLPENLPKGI